MTLSYAESNIVLGAGRFFIDRHDGKNGPTGAEEYVGDTVGATVSATTERTTIFSGDGAVASKLIDKVTQIDRSMGITPQDSRLDNIALFLIANQPATRAEVANASIPKSAFAVPSGSTVNTVFQLGCTPSNPAGAPRFADAAEGTAWTVAFKFGDTAGDAPTGTALVDADYTLDKETGRLQFTAAGLAKVSGKHVVPTFTGAKLLAFERVSVDSDARQVRVAVRYIEEADEGIEGRNIYIPQASVSPAGEAALKSRDTAQQFALTLAVEEPSYTGAPAQQMYIDGVPA
ncbi:MAG: hypothetical protein F4Y03_07095 [Alphaproteobacteria bacterium]|nr:hypothetical protein [Alphaproteobacteria bacterium]